MLPVSFPDFEGRSIDFAGTTDVNIDVFSLIVGVGIIAYSFGLAPITGSDPAGNAMSNGYRGILHISAAGGAGVAALFHLTRIYIPKFPEPALNILRYIVFLLLSLPGGMMGAWIVAEALV